MGEVTLQDIAIQNARIETKIDQALENQVYYRETLGEHDRRLNRLETAHSWVKGGFFTLTGIGAAVTFMLAIGDSVVQYFRH